MVASADALPLEAERLQQQHKFVEKRMFFDPARTFSNSLRFLLTPRYPSQRLRRL